MVPLLPRATPGFCSVTFREGSPCGLPPGPCGGFREESSDLRPGCDKRQHRDPTAVPSPLVEDRAPVQRPVHTRRFAHLLGALSIVAYTKPAVRPLGSCFDTASKLLPSPRLSRGQPRHRGPSVRRKSVAWSRLRDPRRLRCTNTCRVRRRRSRGRRWSVSGHPRSR